MTNLVWFTRPIIIVSFWLITSNGGNVTIVILQGVGFITI